MKYKAIIFDMDGTIVDTEKVWFMATMKVIENRNIALTPETINSLKDEIHGLHLLEACKLIKDTFNISCELQDMVKEKLKAAHDIYHKGISFIEGFETFHSKLHNLNIKSAIATNAEYSTLKITDNELGLKKFFGNHMYCINDVNHKGKPNPDIFLYVCDKLNVDPKESIVIEDSAHGIKAAKEAGIYCIGINTSKNIKQLENADIIVDRYQDIILNKILEIR